MKKLLLSSLAIISYVLMGGSFNVVHAAAATPKPTLLPKELLGYIEPQEYLRTPRTPNPSNAASGHVTQTHQTTLIQLPVLDQYKEPEKKGSTKNSSAYHALRNGVILLKALIDNYRCIEGLVKLYDKEDLYNKLSYEGTWRKAVRSKRHGNFTDSLSLKELQILMDEENKTGDLAGKNIPCAYFEYANQDEPTERDFEVFNVSENLKKIKEKLAADEDFAALILVYVDTHSANNSIFEKKPVKCTVEGPDCIGRALKKTPCCGNALCDPCWGTSLADNLSACPMCKSRNPGPLEEETIKLATNKPLTGQFVAFVLAKVQGKRQYFLMDSANEKHRFPTNKPIKRLLQYLEDPNDPQEKDASLLELPRFIPDPRRVKDARIDDFVEAFKDYKNSYNPVPQKTPAALQKQTEALSKAKGFIGGAFGICALYACLTYYQRSQKPNSPQATTPTVQ